MNVLEPPTLWLVDLRDGSSARVWANSCSSPTAEDDWYTFGVLVDASREEQWSSEVLARTPANPGRVEVCVARFEAQAVKSVVNGMAGG